MDLKSKPSTMSDLAVLKANNLVEKRNILNEMKAKQMSLQEIRFFSIYLSKINPRDDKSRYVKFPLADFRAIMNLGRVTIPTLQAATDKLLSRIVNIRTESGGYSAFQLFSKCRVDKDSDGAWYVEIDAHNDALPLMFDFKREYFTYELWNVLALNSQNHIRIFEILKQYEKIGTRVVSLQELREFIGIEENQYPRFNDFKQWVLESARVALKESTDIYFEYETIKKGPKVVAIKFFIFKNKDFLSQLSLSDFIDTKTCIEPDEADFEEEVAKRGDKINEIIALYRELPTLSKKDLSDDQLLALNDASFEYLLQNNKIGYAPLLDQVQYVAKQALYVNAMNPDHFYSYLMAAVKENYAGI